MWVKINGFENYSINESGEVRNDETGKIKKTYTNKANGYKYVDLWQGGKGAKRPIHRLIATAFIPNPDNKPTIDHKDGDRQNNALENLRWATYSEQNSRFNTNGVRSQKIKATHYQESRESVAAVIESGLKLMMCYISTKSQMQLLSSAYQSVLFRRCLKLAR